MERRRNGAKAGPKWQGAVGPGWARVARHDGARVGLGWQEFSRKRKRIRTFNISEKAALLMIMIIRCTAEPAYSRLQGSKEFCLLKEKSTIAGIE